MLENLIGINDIYTNLLIMMIDSWFIIIKWELYWNIARFSSFTLRKNQSMNFRYSQCANLR